jgi:Domain of unknown function (DUF4416)
MGNTEAFGQEKLMMGLLFACHTQAAEAKQLLQEVWGAIDFVSQTYIFSDHSPYYNEEMGSQTVYRQFISFAQLIDPQDLASIKLHTNQIEARFMQEGLRPINIDPGLINTGRLILATTKYTAHRFALQQGIYGELTLFYSRKQWQFLPWTYLDFRNPSILQDLSTIRKLYRKNIRSPNP